MYNISTMIYLVLQAGTQAQIPPLANLFTASTIRNEHRALNILFGEIPSTLEIAS